MNKEIGNVEMKHHVILKFHHQNILFNQHINAFNAMKLKLIYLKIHV